MAKLEDLTRGAAVRGILPDCLVSVIDVKWFGSAAVELTYKDPSGKWRLVTVNPVFGSEPPVPKKKRGIALSPSQQDILVAAAGGPWCLGPFLEVCAATGARRGEVLALRWSDLQDDRVIISRSQTKRGLAFKTTKTEDSVRPVSLPPSTVAALEAHRKQQAKFRQQFGPDYRADEDLIFANLDGTPLKPDSISATVSPLSRRLKLPKGVSLHTLRHTHGSHLLAGGMEITAVSELLGHSSPRVTQDVDSHAICGWDDAAAQVWEKFQGRSLPEKQGGKVQ